MLSNLVVSDLFVINWACRNCKVMVLGKKNSARSTSGLLWIDYSSPLLVVLVNHTLTFNTHTLTHSYFFLTLLFNILNTWMSLKFDPKSCETKEGWRMARVWPKLGCQKRRERREREREFV